MYNNIMNAVRTIATITVEQLPAILRSAPPEHRQMFADTLEAWRPDLTNELRNELDVIERPDNPLSGYMYQGKRWKP